jgi:hypothetical protein
MRAKNLERPPVGDLSRRRKHLHSADLVTTYINRLTDRTYKCGLKVRKRKGVATRSHKWTHPSRPSFSPSQRFDSEFGQEQEGFATSSIRPVTPARGGAACSEHPKVRP